MHWPSVKTAEIQPTGQVVPKLRRVEMIFAEPMYFTGDSTDPAVLREATNKIMDVTKGFGLKLKHTWRPIERNPNALQERLTDFITAVDEAI